MPELDERLVDVLVDRLVALGVVAAFGVVGGGVAPLAEALDRNPAVEVLHTRHETGAAFAAAEASLTSGRPAVVFTTNGPGLTNALTGLHVARLEGAQVIVVSGATPARLRERWPLQESTPTALLAGAYESGPLFHQATVLERPEQLAVALRRLAGGLRRPQGFVAHLAIPTDVQCQRIPPLPDVGEPGVPSNERFADPRDVARCARLVERGKTVLWVGYGARHCAPLVRALARRLDAPVMSTPRGKGVFDEREPTYLGVTGLGGHAQTPAAVARLQPDHVLVLGSRLGELSSNWDSRLTPTGAFIHVDIDPDVPGRAYPETPTVAVRAEISEFVERLLGELGPDERLAPGSSEPSSTSWHSRLERPSSRTSDSVHPAVLVDAIQRVIVDRDGALVLADVGNALAWTIHRLCFARPGAYRANLAFGSMGHAAAGVIGAALHHPDKAVAIVGDGAMLMNCEVSTAVRYRLPIVWIVLNDSSYGMVAHGMRDAGLRPVQTDIPPTNFMALARAMGADGTRVTAESEIERELRRAMASPDPFVVDVVVDPSAAPPAGARFDMLREQGVCDPGDA